MVKTGYIKITVKGKYGNFELNTDNADINQIKIFLVEAEKLLFPDKRKSRPRINYSMKSGSLINIFKTTVQSVIAFNALLGSISQENSIDHLEFTTAQAIESFQNDAIKNDYEYKIKTSIDNSSELTINKKLSFCVRNLSGLMLNFISTVK